MASKAERETYFIGRMMELTIKDDGDPTIYIPLNIDLETQTRLAEVVGDPAYAVTVCVLVIPIRSIEEEGGE